MFTGKFIKNFVFDGKGLRAHGRSGNLTRVFAEQGDLDGSCSVYSLMMMLIFHQKLEWADLKDGERAKDCEFVDHIQRLFLRGLNGCCANGHTLEYLSFRLNQCFGENLSEVFTITSGRYNSVSRRELHLKIRAQLDARKPVLLGFHRKSGTGHAVVVVGYRREDWNRLRLFCLDPGRMLPFMQVWNNVIDLNYLAPDTPADEQFMDINHYEDNKVYVDTILIIHNSSSESACPF